MNNSVSVLLMIIGMVTVTFGVRMAPLVVDHIRLSPFALRFLNKVPAAVLAALVAVPILEPTLAAQNILQPELIAALVCLILGLTGVHMLATVILGMGSYWVLATWL